MGEVWRAEDQRLGRPVALKCLREPTLHQKPSGDVLRERFAREARVAASLQHRGIATVHDFGEEAGLLYLVMELLDGQHLGQLLRSLHGAPLPLPDAVDITRQVVDALAYTHARQVVHRDLKPANILRTLDGTVKICDFGIAQISRDILPNRPTADGTAQGTPHYMAPEQIRGEPVDHRCDLYALGCVLYELATARPPFTFTDPWVLMLHHRDTTPARAGTRRVGVPKLLDQLIQDLLAKRPEQRPADAVEVARRLATVATALQGSETTTFPGTTPPAPEPDSTADPPRNLLDTLVGGPPALSATLPVPPTTPVPEPTGRAREGAVRDRARPRTRSGPDPTRDAPTPDEHGQAGHWQQALALLRSLVAERARLLGPDHPDTLASRFEEGYALGKLGRWEESLRAYQAVAALQRRVHGPCAAEILRSRQEIAFTLGRLGRYAEAHATYREVLLLRKSSMDDDHPDVLRCRHNMAVNLGRMGRVQESYQLAREVAEVRSRVLGAQHPETLVTLDEVGYGLGQLSRWQEALRTHRGVAAARARTLGPDHPDTLVSRYEVGCALGRLLRPAEAAGEYRALIGAHTRVNGPDHPDTLRARHGYGVNLGRLGHWDAALAEARDVARLRGWRLAPEHLDTLLSRREIAVALGWLGQWEEALGEYSAVVEGRLRALGPDHPDTRAARREEANCRRRLESPAEPDGNGEVAVAAETGAATGTGAAGEHTGAFPSQTTPRVVGEDSGDSLE